MTTFFWMFWLMGLDKIYVEVYTFSSLYPKGISLSGLLCHIKLHMPYCNQLYSSLINYVTTIILWSKLFITGVGMHDTKKKDYYYPNKFKYTVFSQCL